MRYIIAPLGLTTEQREVYFLLYSKMDFDTNLVKYTLEQLNTDSNVKLELTKKKVSYIIKKFIDDGLLTIIKKGSKGNPTIYKIINMKELNLGTQRELKGNTKETQREVKSNLKCSDSNGLNDVKEHKGHLKETQRELKGNTKVTPIIDKDKDKEIDKEKKKDNIYTEIFNYYLSLDLIKHKQLTLAIKKAIDLAIRENKYTLEEMKELIDRHKAVTEATKNDGKYAIRVRELKTFFGQKIQGGTALICTQYEDGGKYYNLSQGGSNGKDRKVVNAKNTGECKEECQGDMLARLAKEYIEKNGGYEKLDVGELPF